MPTQYHTGVGQSARAQFGVPEDGYESYFPSYMTPEQYYQAAYESSPEYHADSDPRRLKAISDAVESERFAANLDTNDQTQMTGLARLMGRGVVDPKAGAVMMSAMDRAERARDRQEALDWRKQDAEARRQLMEQKAQTPTVSQISKLEKLGAQYEQLNEMSDAAKDEAKAKAAQRFYGTKAIPLDLAEGSKDPYKGMTPEAWKRGYHGVHDKVENDYIATVESMLKSGIPVDERHLENYKMIKESREGGRNPEMGVNPQSTKIAPQVATSAAESQQQHGVIISSQEEYDKIPSGTLYQYAPGKFKLKK